jgi:O-antigen/teichoic acid export membrane protein
MMVVLAKMGSPEMVGLLILALAIAAPVFRFSSLALRTVIATDARQQYVFGEYLALRLVTTTAAFAVVAGIALVGGYRGEAVGVILAVGLSMGALFLGDVYHGRCQQHERMDVVARSMMAKGVLSLAALAVGVWVTGTVVYAVLAMAAVRVLVLVAYDIPQARSVHPSEAVFPVWRSARIRGLFLLSLPLGAAVSLGSLIQSIPRFVVERHYGEYELGIFGALASLIAAGNMIVAALARTACPRLARYHATGNRRMFAKLLAILLGLGALTGAAGVLVALVAGRPILLLFFGPQYAAHSDLLVALMVLGALLYTVTFLGYATTALRRFRIQPVLCGACVPIVLVASRVLVPSYGLIGAVIAQGIASLLLGLGFAVVIGHALNTSFQDRA